MASMGTASEKISFPAEEEAVLELWNKIKAFETSLELSKDKPEYSFYDGPPFATGLPHYGHLLAGTIKDTVTRYATQTGHYVNRRFGWDCHGLPVEFEIDKKLGIQSSHDVMKMGIDKYNAECRSIVQRYSSEWETIVTRLGRWIDFKQDYKTMEPWYMESVWWVFKSLWQKQLVYRGFKVMPYSTACTTPLSNFEANLNYRESVDPAIVVTFPLRDDPATSFVAWTTTPWTLPSNMALCVHPELTYLKIKDLAKGAQYILAEARISQLYPKAAKKGYKGGEYEVLEKMTGKQLEGTNYEPLFKYFWDAYQKSAWRILCDNYVTDDAGTGVVHQAPAFGEDDYRVCLSNGVISKGDDIPCPVDENGHFTAQVVDFVGMHVKEADTPICAELKNQGRLVQKSSIKHSYPFCWRSDTPLIYKAVPSWFVKVEDIKGRLLENNTKTHWVPSFVQEKRFHNWLSEARDWAVSRNRYWGTPLPIWMSEDGEEIVVVGSIGELQELTGQKVEDLHRESIDHLTIPSKQGKGELRRVPEVFDCWFESGSMPYAQIHYPFENKERFEKSYFPADFIAEGLDQTRGWFYTLMVLATALFDQPAFKNLIVNGLVLASDGKKMSKRLQNYPDPMLVVSRYGSDALRMYLINSPVVRAEPLKFKEEGVNGVLREVMLPWYNAFRFFIQNAQRVEVDGSGPFVPDLARATGSTNPMDHWIIAASQGLIKFVREEMAAYRLYTVVPRLVQFIEQLTNWYIRLNRQRLKGLDGGSESRTSLAVLYEVLMTLCRLMAPFTPFFTETLYQKLRLAHPDVSNEAIAPDAVGRAESVHYLSIPEYDPAQLDANAEAQVEALQLVVDLGRKARERRNLSLKNPAAGIIVVTADKNFLERVQRLESYVSDELNAVQVTTTADESEWCNLSLRCEAQILGKRLGKAFRAVKDAVSKLSSQQVNEFVGQTRPRVLKVEANGTEYELGEDAVAVVREFKGDSKRYEAATPSDGSILVLLDCEQNDQLRRAGLAREVTARVQKLRKRCGLEVADNVNTFVKVLPRGSDTLTQAVQDLKMRSHEVADLPSGGGIAVAEAVQNKANSASNDTLLPPAEACAFLSAAISEHADKFEASVRSQLLPDCPESRPSDVVVIGVDESQVGGALLRITLVRPFVRFAADKTLQATLSSNATAQTTGGASNASTFDNVAELKKALRVREVDDIKATFAKESDQFSVIVNGVPASIKLNEHVFLDGVKHMLHSSDVQQAWSEAGFAGLVAHYTNH